MTTETTHQPLPRRSESGMQTRAINAAAGVLQAAMEQGRQTPTGLAIALDSARLLDSPETAAHVAELEAQRETLVARLKRGQEWQPGRNPALVSQDYLSQDELRAIFRIPLVAPWDDDEDPCRPCGCPKRFARHADGCPTLTSRERGVLDRARAALGARMAKDALQLVLENVITYAAELEAQRDRRRARLVALQNDALDMRGSLAPNGEARKVPFELGETLTPAVDWLIGRVAELEAQLAEYERPVDEDPIAYTLTEQADDVTPQVAKLRALLAGQATDGSEFFEPGHAYTHRPGPDDLGGPRLRFACESVTTDKATGQPVARGWGGRRYGDRWTSVQRARGLEDWQSGAWVDTTAGGDAR